AFAGSGGWGHLLVLEDGMRKIVSLRSAVIMGVSVVAGSVVGGAVEALGQTGGVGGVVSGAVALWFAERLDRVVGD
ncbi:MAG TPA: hypothetical protein VIU15_30890, partial [Streptomyces sp.]